jgi:hypothetical protein
MIQRVSTSIGLLVLGGSLAFSQAQPQKPAAPVPAPQQQDETVPVLAVPKDYHYNARGRRDPFVNPVPKPVQKVAPGPPPQAVRPPGLRGVLVAEADIIGIVVSREPSMNVVTIAAPGGKRYFARVGDSLFDAVLRGIRADSVTFTVTAPGLDPSAPREIVRKMRGEKQ